MISEMETIQILSSRLREEELENERLRREKDAESEKVLRAVEDARVARESAEQYRAQLEEERKAQGDRIESMLKEVMMFITGKGTASLSESLSDSIIKKMQEQHARELAEQRAADEERFEPQLAQTVVYGLRCAARSQYDSAIRSLRVFIVFLPLPYHQGGENTISVPGNY